MKDYKCKRCSLSYNSKTRLLSVQPTVRATYNIDQLMLKFFNACMTKDHEGRYTFVLMDLNIDVFLYFSKFVITLIRTF